MSLDLNTVANILQIVTSITFFVAAYRWGRDKMKGHGVAATAILLLLAASVGVSGALLLQRAGWWFGPKIENVTDCYFKDKAVVLDDHAYYGCTFEHVQFQYGGGPTFLSQDTRYLGQSDVRITNQAANKVLEYLLKTGVVTKQPQAHIEIRPPQ